MATLSQAGPLAQGQLAAGWNTFTVPAGKVWKISGWDLANPSASAETIKVAINGEADTNIIQPAVEIAAGQSWPRYREMTIKAATTLKFYATTGGRVSVTIHGVEITL